MEVVDAKPKVIICSPDTSDLVRTVLESLEADLSARIAVFCYGDGGWSRQRNLWKLLKEAGDRDEDVPAPYESPSPSSEAAVILWSSGTTTGVPKGILHSHSSILNFSGHLETVFAPNTATLLTGRRVLRVHATTYRVSHERKEVQCKLQFDTQVVYIK